MERENEYLKNLIEIEDLAEKKTKIYSRLLIEPALASAMEELSLRHKKRRETIERLLYGGNAKDGGMSAMKKKEKGE